MCSLVLKCVRMTSWGLGVTTSNLLTLFFFKCNFSGGSKSQLAPQSKTEHQLCPFIYTLHFKRVWLTLESSWFKVQIIRKCGKSERFSLICDFRDGCCSFFSMQASTLDFFGAWGDAQAMDLSKISVVRHMDIFWGINCICHQFALFSRNQACPKSGPWAKSGSFH